MKTLKKLVISTLLIFAVFGFIISITEMPADASDGAGNKYCYYESSSPQEYCWMQGATWQCALSVGGKTCTLFGYPED